MLTEDADERHPARVETAFQVGVRPFSMLLVYVPTTGIFMANVVLHRPILDAAGLTR